MGTNYYWIPADPDVTFLRDLADRRPLKEECVRLREIAARLVRENRGLHIGKSSAGWVFCFHAHPDRDIHTFEDWKRAIASGTIVDEYGCELDRYEFIEIVETRRQAVPPLKDFHLEHGHETKTSYRDPAGHPFCNHEFS